MKLNRLFKTLIMIMVLSLINFYNVNAEEVKGTKVGGKTYTWGITYPDAYNQYTLATNEVGDTKSANEIGIDYCDLLETATSIKSGAFRVEYQLSDGTRSNSIYIIPKIKVEERNSYIYFREEGSQQSLLPDGDLYKQTVYSLRPGNYISLSWNAKEFQGYEFTRSVVQTSTNKGFYDELTGEAGKNRNGSLTYSSDNDFNVIFYYKKVEPSNKNIINFIYNNILIKLNKYKVK